jgi:hypothetical protein
MIKNNIYIIIWTLKRLGYLKKELKNLLQQLLYQPQSRFLLESWDAPSCPLEVIKFYSFIGRICFATREYIALISGGKIFKKSIQLDGYEMVDVESLYKQGSDNIPWPKPPLVELYKREIESEIFSIIEKSYHLADKNDPDKFDRAKWWQEMSQRFKDEIFTDGKINREYLANFRVKKEMPTILVKSHFLVVNSEYGYMKSYLKAIDLVLEYHRYAKQEVSFIKL